MYAVLDDRGKVGRGLDMHRVSVVELHIQVAFTMRTSDPDYIH
jgi:hypothetical protein